MKRYDEPDLQVNLSVPPSTWSLDRRLSWTRAKNPNATTGAGARRRSCYEHQLDGMLALLTACDVQGMTVRIPGGKTVTPWDLLHAPAPPSARALAVYRRKITGALNWCRENDPRRTGWALPQSQRRARLKAQATGFCLPHRAWHAFFRFRAVVRWMAQLLHTMHVWWFTLLPPLRSASTTPQASETTSGARQDRSRSERGTGSSPLHVGALVRGAMPRRAM